MKKNVGSQIIGVQMVSATDGSAFTSAVTVYVTGDGGTQAIGSVGSGACTHEGNGYHTYAPAQAETNYDLVAFTFIGTGASPATRELYTRPTTDYASQASVDAVDDFLDTEISAIKTVTDAIGATGSGLSAIPWNASWDTEVQSECADALAALVIEGSYDLVEVMKVLLAFAAGKTDITGSTVTFRDQADSLNRISATVTSGERTAVTLNVT